MPSKRCLTQLKSARAAAVLSSKKRKIEASLVLNLAQPEIGDNKLSTTDTSDTEGEFRTWFWNESANESGSDTEEEGDKKEEEGEDNESNRDRRAYIEQKGQVRGFMRRCGAYVWHHVLF